MGMPAIFVVNMIDAAESAGLSIHVEKLESLLGTRVILTDARSGRGLEELKAALRFRPQPYPSAFRIPDEHAAMVTEMQERLNEPNAYRAWLYLTQRRTRHLRSEERRVGEVASN